MKKKRKKYIKQKKRKKTKKKTKKTLNHFKEVQSPQLVRKRDGSFLAFFGAFWLFSGLKVTSINQG